MGLVSPNLTLSAWLEHDSHKGGRSLHFAMVHNFAWLLYSIKDIRKAQCREWVELVPMVRHMRLKHHPRWQSRVGCSGWRLNISTIVLCPESPGTIRNSLGKVGLHLHSKKKLCFLPVLQKIIWKRSWGALGAVISLKILTLRKDNQRQYQHIRTNESRHQQEWETQANAHRGLTHKLKLKKRIEIMIQSGNRNCSRYLKVVVSCLRRVLCQLRESLCLSASGAETPMDGSSLSGPILSALGSRELVPYKRCQAYWPTVKLVTSPYHPTTNTSLIFMPFSSFSFSLIWFDMCIDPYWPIAKLMQIDPVRLPGSMCRQDIGK